MLAHAPASHHPDRPGPTRPTTAEEIPVQSRLEQETLDYIAIQRLQAAYADCVTRRAWAEFDRLFRPDAEIVVDRMDGTPLVFLGPAGIAGFISNAIARYELFQFVVLNSVVEIEGDRAKARMYMWELRHDPIAGRSDAYGLYRDEHVRIDGRWWFAGRRYQTLARSQPADLTVFPLPAI